MGFVFSGGKGRVADDMVFIWNLHRKVIRGGRESLFHWQFRDWKRWGWAHYFAFLYWTSIKTIDLLENDTFWISSQRNHIFKTKIKRIYYHKWMLPFPLFYRACDMWCFFITEMEQLHWATKSPLIHRLLARSPSKWVLLGRNKNMPVSLFLYLWSFFWDLFWFYVFWHGITTWLILPPRQG